MSDKDKAKSLDETLNFDDLGGETRKIKKRAKKKDTSNKADSAVASNYVLSIPQDDKWTSPNFELKDLSDITGEEFTRWARMVYPKDLTYAQEVFDSYKKRLRMFQKIVMWHKYSFFTLSPKSNPDTKH